MPSLSNLNLPILVLSFPTISFDISRVPEKLFSPEFLKVSFRNIYYFYRLNVNQVHDGNSHLNCCCLTSPNPKGQSLNYDVAKLWNCIRKSLETVVEKGILVFTKGTVLRNGRRIKKGKKSNRREQISNKPATKEKAYPLSFEDHS